MDLAESAASVSGPAPQYGTETYLEKAAPVERRVVVPHVVVADVPSEAIAVHGATLAAECLERAVLRKDAAVHVGGPVVLVQPAAQISHLAQMERVGSGSGACRGPVSIAFPEGQESLRVGWMSRRACSEFRSRLCCCLGVGT